VALGISADTLLSLATQVRQEKALAPPPATGEHPDLSRIIHILREWPTERLALLRKLVDVADSQLKR
jgi:hypothetical protein